MIHTLFETDFKFIIWPLIVIGSATIGALLQGYFKANPVVNIVRSEYIWMDDKGHSWSIVAADIQDASEILREEHDISVAYFRRHVFLAEVRNID